MDEVIELRLSQAIGVTDSAMIRSTITARIAAAGLEGPEVELVQFHVFIHCTGGSGKHMVDFEDHEMTPGTAIWVRPGQVQRWGNDDAFDADVMVFASSSIPDLPLFDRFVGATAVAHVGNDADRLRRLTAWIADDLANSHDRAASAAAVSVILRVFARHVQPGDDSSDTPGRRLATAFVDSIDGNIGQRSVAWHAREVGASTRSVARATVGTLGQRPKEVIDARVVLEARRRLAWSDADVATIARALKFSEPSNFTKFFRTRTGISPTAFREAATTLAVTSPGDS